MNHKCPECGSTKLKREIREVTCKKCGLVIDDKVFISGKIII